MKRSFVRDHPVWGKPECPIGHGFLEASMNFPEDRERFESIFGLELELLQQTHSAEYVRVPSENESRRADAWVFERKGERKAYGILTADCTPVIVVGKTLVSVLHLGWRGASNGLLMRVLEEFPQGPVELLIGPRAQSCCYEVDTDIVDELWVAWMKLGGGRGDTEFLKPKASGKLSLNLDALLRRQAQCTHEASIQSVPACTMCSPDFFSFRRQGAAAGRQLSFATPR